MLKRLKKAARRAKRRASGQAYQIPDFFTVKSVLGDGVEEVIDVGVHDGTPPLYKAFADAKFVLIDPRQDAQVALKFEPPKPYTFLNMGMADSPGELTLNFHGGKSSFLERTELTQVDIEDRYTVPVDTLDSVIEEHCTSSRIGVKVDTEGFEGQIMRGLDKTRHRVAFVVLEASILRRFEGAHDFSEITAIMLERGFHFYNLMNPVKWPARRYYDAVFLPAGHKAFQG